MKKLALGTLGVGLIAAFGCGEGGAGSLFGQNRQALEALVPLQGCQEVEDYVRETLTANVNRYVDRQIETIEKAQYGCNYGYYGGPGSYADAGVASGASNSGAPTTPAPAPASADSSGSSKGPSQASGTNNQVAGVDEADFVKNDGKYVYVVANGALRILKSWPAHESAPLAKVTLEGEPRKLFVEGDRAVVYVAVQPTPKDSYGGYSPYSSYGECTYGYECVPSGDGTSTKILVFDISDRTAPTKIREIDLSGSLLAARRIGTTVHTVLTDKPVTLPSDLDYRPESKTCNPSDPIDVQKSQMKDAWEAVRAKNLARIAELPIKPSLPTVTENGSPAVAECSGYFRPNRAEGGNFTSIVSFELGGGAPQTATIVSDPGVVYASETALYMSVPHTREDGGDWYPSMQEEKQASTVHKFRIGAAPSLTGYEASGLVKGRVLNQFALDEHAGHIRVATTTGHAPSDKTHSTMSILRRDSGGLVLTGKVDHIAPSEDIRSVRFDGSRAYVVTFKKTDPLYVFDLGNPGAPKITGELKIPGFSTYMHMMDAEHLLTIGYDADDQGSFAWFQGVMLQIFDVSDMKNPRLAHKEVIGTRGSSSEALTNHLAFTYFAPKNLLALPMTVCEGGSGGSYGTNMTFSGLMVYDATAASGFALKGRVAHPNSSTSSSSYDSSGCSSWWTQARSEVKRSIVMDDFVYSISERRMKVNALGDLGTDLADVSLEN